MPVSIIERNPAIYYVALYMFVSMGRLHELVPGLGGLPIGKLCLLLALWAAFTMDKERPALIANNHVLVKRVLYLVILAVVSVSFSVWKSHSLDVLKGPFLSLIILFFLIIKTTKSYQDLKFYFFALLVIAGALAFSTATLGATGRLTVGNTFDPNDLAMVLVTISPFAVVFFLKASGTMKIALGGLMATILLAIILTGSRGGFLGLVAVGGYLSLKRYPGIDGEKGKIYFFRKLVLAVVAVSLFFAFSPPEYIERINSLFNLESDYNVSDTRKGRLAIWGSGIDMMLSKPYGVGVGAFAAAQGMLVDDGAYKAAHNSLILIGVELGFIGLFLYLSFYLLALKHLSIIQSAASPEKREMCFFNIALRAALLGFFVTSFFLSQAYSPLFYCMVTFSVLLSIFYEKDELESQGQPSGQNSSRIHS